MLAKTCQRLLNRFSLIHSIYFNFNRRVTRVDDGYFADRVNNCFVNSFSNVTTKKKIHLIVLIRFSTECFSELRHWRDTIKFNSISHQHRHMFIGGGLKRNLWIDFCGIVGEYF